LVCDVLGGVAVSSVVVLRDVGLGGVGFRPVMLRIVIVCV
jgi:hypothetical protein